MREYALVFAVAAAVTYLMTPLARRLALAWGAMAEPRDRDVHAIATPRLGGLAMYAGFAAALQVARALPALSSTFSLWGDWKAVLLAGGLICAVGVVDDRWGLDAFTKLTGQALAAGVLVLLGIQMAFVKLPGWEGDYLSLPTEYATVATVLLALFMVNSINFIDGLDGLAAGVVAIAALAFFVFCYELSVVLRVQRATPATLISAILAGVCIGFLPHNFHPARVFMGDSGSMLLGLMLAAAMMSGTGLVDPNAIGPNSIGDKGSGFLFPVLLPLPVLAVPFVDLLLAVFRRTRAGRSVFTPDKEHLHHRLLEIGHSQRRAVVTIYFWSALIAFGGVASAFIRPMLVLAVIAGVGALGIVATILVRVVGDRRRDGSQPAAVAAPRGS